MTASVDDYFNPAFPTDANSGNTQDWTHGISRFELYVLVSMLVLGTNAPGVREAVLCGKFEAAALMAGRDAIKMAREIIELVRCANDELLRDEG